MNTQTKLEALEARTARLERSAWRWRAVSVGLAGLAVGGVLMAQRAPEDIGERWPWWERQVAGVGVGTNGIAFRVWSDGATDVMIQPQATHQWNQHSEAWYASSDDVPGSYNAQQAWRPLLDAPYPSP